MDVIVRVADFPRAGETIMARAVSSGFGGKGANQAVAAARMGGRVAMIGALGADANGAALRAALESDGVDTRAVRTLAGATSGVAHVMVCDSGQNMITVLSGANAQVTPADVDAGTPFASVYLAQLETPVAAVEAFFALATARGAMTILNPAPAVLAGARLFPLADIVVLNESELETFSGQKVSGHASMVGAVAALRPGEAQTVIVTRGSMGAWAMSPAGLIEVPALDVAVVDTTGAGDCFCGVLAAGLSQGRVLRDAMARANAAAAIAVGRPGAGPSAPTAAEFEAFLGANAAGSS